ncbi:hypothetical protein COO59_10350 [Mixta theicola]|uniref:DUF1795 domain-containing protein n=1 Tax=Mixta theicola TaxID=1458355 RepID=A0A2K1QA57_9GAMM|nr:DcrB-related protein [Mixta theicola]PNS11877.1 hypothetical protein COO59_10350 [Mixta theicola]GLR07807.1 hypothetical protein GCM10007905_05260 [Mixta theicola]
MSEYTLQECMLTLPDLLHDRTMNLFTLGGANEFTFVISRAPAQAGDTLQSVSTRLAEELQTNLPELGLIHVELTELDGIPALELFYSFKSGQRTLLQKQRVVLLDEAFQGKKLLCFIGTCPDAFDASHARVYDLITATVRFHHPSPPAQPISNEIPADSPSVYFSFDRESRELLVFQGMASLYASVDLNRAKQGDYLFFDSGGHRLSIGPVAREDNVTRYALWKTAEGQKQTMIHTLLLAKSVRGIPGLETADAIEVWLCQQINQQ